MQHHSSSKRRAWAAWLSFAAALFAAVPAAAQDTDLPAEDTLETTRGLGMGSGARASAVGTSALAYNAANLPLGRLYHVESIVGYYPGEGAWSLGAAVADSVSNKIAAGMSFRGIFGDGDRPFSGWDGRLSLGLPLSDRIAVGIGGRYIDLDPDGQGPDGEPLGTGVSGFTLDASIRVTPADGFHIAALGYNLIDQDSALTPVLVGGSAGYGVESFSIGADFLVDLTTHETTEFIAGGGVEYLAGGSVPLRLGYRHDTGRDQKFITASLGYVDQTVGVDLALRQALGGDGGTALVFSFRYHVQ